MLVKFINIISIYFSECYHLL